MHSTALVVCHYLTKHTLTKHTHTHSQTHTRIHALSPFAGEVILIADDGSHELHGEVPDNNGDGSLAMACAPSSVTTLAVAGQVDDHLFGDVDEDGSIVSRHFL